MNPFLITRLLPCLLSLCALQAFAGQPRVAKPIYLEGEILVRYRAQAPAASDPAQKRLGLSAKYGFSDGRTQLLRLPAFTTVESMLRVLHEDSTVELAEPNFLRFARTVIPNDTLFSDQWGLSSTGQPNFLTSDPALASVPGADMNLIQAWDADNDGDADRTGSSSVIVAVIDDAVQTTHPDFAANIVPGRDFVNSDNNPDPDNADEGHGTSVSGCIGAVGNNGIGVAGVAWNVKLMPLKFGFDTASLLLAMDYARDHGAKIVNMSFGGPGFSQMEQDKINALAANDILFVAAHGNDDSNTDLAQLNYPANYDAPNILSVAATNRQDNIASFSQYGSLTADVAAPGLQIVTTAINSGYMTNPGIAGTSFSSPYASGAAALLRSHVSPAPDFREIRARLIESGSSVSGANSRFRTSGGRIDVDKALELAAGPALVLKAFSVDPSGNQALDPAENATVTIVVENLWQDATGVSATLSADLGISVNNGAQSLGSIPAQGTASASFNLSVPGGINNHRYVNFRVTLTANGAYSTQRAFMAEIGRVQNAVQIVQNFTDDLYDEYHAWHFTIPSTPAGTNTLVIRTSTPAPDHFDVDLLVKKDIPPQYSITVGINPEVDSGFFCTSGTQAHCQDPDTLVSGRFDGKEGITVVNPTAGTYHLVVVNFAQTMVDYTLDAAILPGDLRPDAFSIPPKTNVASDSLVISDPVTISGITAPTFITVEPQGEYSINNGAFTQADGMVANGQQVRMRVLSATATGASCAVGLTIGGVEDFFLVKTGSGGATGSITSCTKGQVIPPGDSGGGGGPMPQILLGVLLALSLLRLRH